MRLLDRLRASMHRHAWGITASNPYGYTAEERCECGAYRHRWPNPDLPLGVEEPWVDGPHPTARRLRAEGMDRTEGYDRRA